MIIAWDESFRVGVAEIDDQHRDLIETFNRLVDTLQNEKGRIRPITIINELTGKVKAHSEYEEDLLKASGYPEIETHVRDHQNFHRDVEELSGRMLTSVRLDLQHGSVKILGQRLVDHTRDHDRDLLNFVKTSERP